MKIDLDRFIVIDNHCHSLLQQFLLLDSIAFRQAFSESNSIGLLQEHLPTSIHYSYMLRRLADLLGVSKDEQEILEYRARNPEKDYIDQLWDEASIGALIVDDGFRKDDMISLAQLRALCGRPVYRCPRIETVLEACLHKAGSFDELLKLFQNALFESGAQRTVALKTIAAYRGGLDLKPVSDKAARDDFTELKRNLSPSGNLRITRRPLYDFLLLQSFSWAGENGLPVQLHAGIGDDDAYLPLASPLCLQSLLKTERFARTNFVFLHCYPFVAEAAYLASLYPNVYLDLSLSLSLAAPAAKQIIACALAAAPTSKILAGTDGHNTPESHWFGAVLLKEALAHALSELVESGFVSEKEAYDIAGRILHENSMKLYSLDDLV
jgi:predicted TIM-barrel fold metal-dependent hydrolase